MNSNSFIYFWVFMLLFYSSQKIQAQISDCNITVTGGVFEICEDTHLMPYKPPRPAANHAANIFSHLEWTTGYAETNDWYADFSQEMKLHIYYPTPSDSSVDLCEGPLQVIVFGYGSGFMSKYEEGSALVPKWLAAQGFIVVAPEYRIGLNVEDPELSKRSTWRALQDIRQVNKYARTISEEGKYCADTNKPLVYVGWSSGAVIGLHNLYLTDAERPVSTTGAYQFEHENTLDECYGIAETYDLGTLDNPFMGRLLIAGPKEPEVEDQSSEGAIPEITIAMAGAIGDIEWLNDSSKTPTSLYMLHHPSDGVVPYETGVPFSGVEELNYGIMHLPEMYGSKAIHDVITAEESLLPEHYKFAVVSKNCDLYFNIDCIDGNAGGEEGPVGKTWYHSVAEDPLNTLNESVMQSIIEFIDEANEGHIEFVPVDGQAYTIKNQDGFYLASDGESTSPYVVEGIPDGTPAYDLLWQFIETNTEGQYIIERYYGGDKSILLSSDDHETLEMGDFDVSNLTQFTLPETALESGIFHLTLNNIDSDKNTIVINEFGNAELAQAVSEKGMAITLSSTEDIYTEDEDEEVPSYFNDFNPKNNNTVNVKASKSHTTLAMPPTGTTEQFIIEFTNKGTDAYPNQESVDNLSFLWNKAKNRVEGFVRTEDDLPVNSAYKNLLIETQNNVFQGDGTTVTIHSESRWMNCIRVTMSRYVLSLFRVANPDIIENFWSVPVYTHTELPELSDPIAVTTTYNNYTELGMLELDKQHEAGYTGTNIRIGVIDGTFSGTNTLEPLRHLYTNDRIIYAHNYSTDNNNPYAPVNSIGHGTKVLSTLAAYYEDESNDLIKYHGAAYDAEYILGALNMEENLKKPGAGTAMDYSYAVAVEDMEAKGVDVINTSLSFGSSNSVNVEDQWQMAPAKVNELATERGVITVAAVGNFGVNNQGQEVTYSTCVTPGDAPGTLAVGSIRDLLTKSNFSSMGPSRLGDIKPDVCALGANTLVLDPTINEFTYHETYGTSFASPLIAGFAGLLREEFTNATASQIVNAIRAAGHNYATPNYSIGYGVPQYTRIQLGDNAAKTILKENIENSEIMIDHLSIYPNPTIESVNIILPTSINDNSNVYLKLYSISGADIASKTMIKNGNILNWNFKHENIPSGVYILTVLSGVFYETVELVIE